MEKAVYQSRFASVGNGGLFCIYCNLQKLYTIGRTFTLRWDNFPKKCSKNDEQDDYLDKQKKGE